MRGLGRSVAAAAVLTVGALMGAGCKSSTSTPADSGMDVGRDPGCPSNPDDLLSDFSLDNGLSQVDGRSGGWYVYGDTVPTGTFDPPAVANAPYPVDFTDGNSKCSGPGSFHVKAMNWTQFGAALGVDFEPRTTNDGGMSVKQTYDATKYKGVAFWAKAAAPIRFVQVKFLDPYTDRDSPLNPDDWCIYTGGSPYNCSPYLVKFGYGNETDGGFTTMADYPKYVDYKIDTTWRRFEIDFADTRQDKDNLGQKSPNDMLQVSQLMGMAIQVNADYSTSPQSANDFEIWLDDVAFVR